MLLERGGGIIQCCLPCVTLSDINDICRGQTPLDAAMRMDNGSWNARQTIAMLRANGGRQCAAIHTLLEATAIEQEARELERAKAALRDAQAMHGTRDTRVAFAKAMPPGMYDMSGASGNANS